jgi:hypothetical protein
MVERSPRQSHSKKNDPEPLKVLEGLATAQALFAAFIERHRPVFESGRFDAA